MGMDGMNFWHEKNGEGFYINMIFRTSKEGYSFLISL
jgi:hypothetical protein